VRILAVVNGGERVAVSRLADLYDGAPAIDRAAAGGQK
jgi:hypothetical protein